MFDDGIANEFEAAHNKGLKHGFDLGWTYKGQFDRSIIRGHIEQIDKQAKKVSDPEWKLRYSSQKEILRNILNEMKNHPCNNENITKHFK